MRLRVVAAGSSLAVICRYRPEPAVNLGVDAVLDPVPVALKVTGELAVALPVLGPAVAEQLPRALRRLANGALLCGADRELTPDLLLACHLGPPHRVGSVRLDPLVGMAPLLAELLEPRAGVVSAAALVVGDVPLYVGLVIEAAPPGAIEPAELLATLLQLPDPLERLLAPPDGRRDLQLQAPGFHSLAAVKRFRRARVRFSPLPELTV